MGRHVRAHRRPPSVGPRAPVRLAHHSSAFVISLLCHVSYQPLQAAWPGLVMLVLLTLLKKISWSLMKGSIRWFAGWCICLWMGRAGARQPKSERSRQAFEACCLQGINNKNWSRARRGKGLGGGVVCSPHGPFGTREVAFMHSAAGMHSLHVLGRRGQCMSYPGNEGIGGEKNR